MKDFERQGLYLTKAAANELSKIERNAVGYLVKVVNDFIALVSNNGKERRVTFAEEGGTCTCTRWDQKKMPCEHAVVARMALKFKPDYKAWYEYAFDPIYLLKNYKEAYDNEDIHPPLLDDVTFEDESAVTRLPPEKYNRPGRRTKKRKRKRTEAADGGPVKQYTCSNCGLPDHNRSTCPLLHGP